MTRLSIAFILLCVLSGALFYWKVDMDKNAEALEKALEAKIPKGIVVFAAHDIPRGSVITADALELRTIDQSRIPETALSLSSVAVGKKAKTGITEGQMVFAYDLDSPVPWRSPQQSLK